MINIYGEFNSLTTDLRLARTALIYDYDLSKFLSELNKSFTPLLTGTSLQRPSNPSKGQPYFDKTLRFAIWWDGELWIDRNGDNADLPHKGDTSERPDPSKVSIGFEYYDTTLKRIIISNGTEWSIMPDSNLYWVTLDEDGNISNKLELTLEVLWLEI